MGVKRRRVKDTPAHKITIAVDVVANAAVVALMERERLTFSGAICALATSAALRDPGLAQAMKVVLTDAVREKLDRDGWHPGLSATLATALVTGEEEQLTWN